VRSTPFFERSSAAASRGIGAGIRKMLALTARLHAVPAGIKSGK